MKKLLASIVLSFVLILFFATSVFAQSGCCSWHGGESYCDYSTGRWVCVDGTYSPTCTCGSTYQAPVYVPPPSCPLNSSYDSLSQTCKCLYGYVSNGSSCISVQQNCWNQYGYNSTYDYGTGQCKCSYGYVFSGGTCTYGTTYCDIHYGYNTQYNSATNKCECRYGYVWNSSGSACISQDEACQNELGMMSRYVSIYDTCDCLAGYTIQGGRCLPQPQMPVYIPQIKKTSISPTYTPATPNVTPTVTATPSPMPTFAIRDVRPMLFNKPNSLWSWLINFWNTFL